MSFRDKLINAIICAIVMLAIAGARPTLATAKTTRTYEVPAGNELVLVHRRPLDWSLSLNGQWTGIDKGPVSTGLEGIFSLNLRMTGSKMFYWKIAGGPGISEVKDVEGDSHTAPSTTELGGLSIRPVGWLEFSIVGRHRAVFWDGDMLNSVFAELQVAAYLDNWLVSLSAGAGGGQYPVMKPLDGGIKWGDIKPPMVRDAESGKAQTFGLVLGRLF